MTAYANFQADLEALGYKVFPTKKLDSVKTAIVWNIISRRAIGSMSGKANLNIERIQVSCFAATPATLRTMVADVENLLVYENNADYLSTPTESKVEGYDVATSTYFSYLDFFLTYRDL